MSLEDCPNCSPLNMPFSIAEVNIELNTSPTILYKSGDIGSPCLRPLAGENSLVGEPLTSIEILEV